LTANPTVPYNENIMNERIKKFPLLFSVIILIFLNPTISLADESSQVSDNKGPLLTNNLYPFYLPFINLLPEDAKSLGTGNVRLIIANNYANTFNLDVDGMGDGMQFDMDLESLRLAINLDVGVSDRLDIGLETAYVYEYGGIFDAVIQEFHKLFGFPNAGRSKVDNFLFRLKYQNANGTWIDLRDPVSGLGDITLKAKLNIINTGKMGFYLAIQPAVKIPIGDESLLLSNGKTDWAVNLLAEKTGYNYGIYINIGWIHVGKPENLQIFDFTENLFSYVICYEWLIRGGWSLYIQADGNSSPYMSGHKRLDDQSGTINLGFKCEIAEKTLLQFSFAEEFFTFATTDISVMLAITFIL
jgi:hypothetical protein